MGIEQYRKMQIEELYEIARKKGVKHNDTIKKDELINRLMGFDSESKNKKSEANKYSVTSKKHIEKCK